MTGKFEGEYIVISKEEWQRRKKEEAVTQIGTAASGNRGHAGRPGERGGSAPGGMAAQPPTLRASVDPATDATKLHSDVPDYTKAYQELPTATLDYLRNQMTDEENHSVSNYAGSSKSWEINRMLRHGDQFATGSPEAHGVTIRTPSPERLASYKEISDSMIGAIDKAPGMQADVELYRGIGGAAAEEVWKMEVGDECTDKGFQSFTLDPSHASKFTDEVYYETKESSWNVGRVVMRAVTQGGEKAIAGSPRENEMIFKPGTKWGVTRVDYVEARWDKEYDPDQMLQSTYKILTVVQK